MPDYIELVDNVMKSYLTNKPFFTAKIFRKTGIFCQTFFYYFMRGYFHGYLTQIIASNGWKLYDCRYFKKNAYCITYFHY